MHQKCYSTSNIKIHQYNTYCIDLVFQSKVVSTFCLHIHCIVSGQTLRRTLRKQELCALGCPLFTTLLVLKRKV
jgi:hypothetical protein